GGAALAAVLVGVPTGILRTSLYRRMTPVLWWNYPVWAVTALLEGFLLASYVRAGAGNATTGKATAGGVLSFLAVGCPVCNKLVVLAIGISGAMSYWAPVQPFLLSVRRGSRPGLGGLRAWRVAAGARSGEAYGRLGLAGVSAVSGLPRAAAGGRWRARARPAGGPGLRRRRSPGTGLLRGAA